MFRSHDRFERIIIRLIDILTILNQLINLGEKFAIYAVYKDFNLEAQQERHFVYIIIGVGAAELLSDLLPRSGLRVILESLIDIGELFAYMFALRRTLTTKIVALTFTGIELFFHLLILSLHGSLYIYKYGIEIDKTSDNITFQAIKNVHKKRKEKRKLEKPHGKRAILRRVFRAIFPVTTFLVINVAQFLITRISSSSEFHSWHFENMVIVYEFFAGVGVEVSAIVIEYYIDRHKSPKYPISSNTNERENKMSPIRKYINKWWHNRIFTEIDEEHSRLMQWWMKLMFLGFILYCAFTMHLAIVCISIKDLVKNRAILTTYDLVVDIVFIAFFVPALIFTSLLFFFRRRVRSCYHTFRDWKNSIISRTQTMR